MSGTAVLFSGGLDSAVLLAHEAREGPVHPLYVTAGLAWEPAERRVVRQLLDSEPFARVAQPLAELEFTVKDLYPPSHWALRGTPPAYDTPDDDVYLVGRNLILIAKASIYCAQRGVSRLALGPLAGNPFPDASPEFLSSVGTAVSLGLDHTLAVVAPFSRMHKDEVVRLGIELGVPLARTLSCMSPVDADHCGACSKCRERQQAFAAAGVTDPTSYRVRRT